MLCVNTDLLQFYGRSSLLQASYRGPFSALLSGVFAAADLTGCCFPLTSLPSAVHRSSARADTGAEMMKNRHFSAWSVRSRHTGISEFFPPCVCLSAAIFKSRFKNHVRIIRPYKEMNERLSFSPELNHHHFKKQHRLSQND